MQDSQHFPTPRQAVQSLPPYSKAFAAAIPPVFHASSNESPLPPAPSVLNAVAQVAAHGNRYPVLHGDDLIEALADHYHVGADHLAVGDGSLTLMTQLLQTYVVHGDEIVFSWRSYEAYPIAAVAVGAVAVEVPNQEDGGHDLEAMAAAVTDRTRAVIVCSPNNPTGASVAPEALRRFLEQVPSRVLVLLDEAYWDFATTGFDGTSLLDEFRNLVVLRTFSKSYGMAGLRVGYLLADPEIVTALRAIQPPFPVNAVGVAAAIAALGEQDERLRLIQKVQEQRSKLETTIADLGLPITHSQSNFIWLPLGDQAEALAAQCSAAGIAVRCFPHEGVRVSLGEEGLVEALTDVVTTYASSLETSGN